MREILHKPEKGKPEDCLTKNDHQKGYFQIAGHHWEGRYLLLCFLNQVLRAC